MTSVGGPSGGWEFVDGEDRRRQAFDELIDDALDQIPSPFRERLNTVAVVSEDEPPPGQVPPGQVLFGLFQGVPRTAWGVDNVAVANKITIYRGPHERFYPDPAARAAAVEATVFHEVAHHFGISDDRLRELQQRR
jgi:predicted Zn-dependent protease with MMP-like domain